MGDSDYLVVCVTAPVAEAPDLARALVERRLAACVNIVPGVRSVYRWKGEICDDQEALLVIKTVMPVFEKLRETVVALHSYELPEVIALNVAGAHVPYLRWIDEMVRQV